VVHVASIVAVPALLVYVPAEHTVCASQTERSCDVRR
jgi:hypothetical protein